MLKRKKLIFILAGVLLVQSCLSSCTTTSYNNCPAWPIAGEKVAKELESAGELPYTWEWIGRINKLREELELCR